jgi:Bacterial regulatory proteins, gntR family
VTPARLAAELTLVRWPLQPLLDRCALTPGRLAIAIGVPLLDVRVAARCGLSDVDADLWATRAGYHPLLVWGWAWIDAATTPPPRLPAVSERIAQDLRSQIDTGALQPGELLPSSTAVAERWGVGRTIVRAALDVLMREGRTVAAGGRRPARVAPVCHDRPSAGDVCDECGTAIEAGSEHYPHQSDCPGIESGWCSCHGPVHPDCCTACATGGQP